MATEVPRDLPGATAHSLFERYREPVYRYCLGRLRSREEAEDALQNTFLRAYAALRRGVEPDFEAPWLYKIAHNVCLSRCAVAARRARVETLRDVTALSETIAAPAREEDELIPLGDALASLAPRLRTALLLREWQGLSYQEIAAELGASVAAVETLIFRARRLLAQALEGSLAAAPRRRETKRAAAPRRRETRRAAAAVAA